MQVYDGSNDQVTFLPHYDNSFIANARIHELKANTGKFCGNASVVLHLCVLLFLAQRSCRKNKGKVGYRVQRQPGGKPCLFTGFFDVPSAVKQKSLNAISVDNPHL